MKLAGMVGSGVEAKIVITEGQVEVNGEVECRRGKKLHDGDIVSFDGWNDKDCRMILKSIELKNFRNYEGLDLKFDSGTNILFVIMPRGRPISLRLLMSAGRLNPTRAAAIRTWYGLERMNPISARSWRSREKNISWIFIWKKNRSKGIAINKVPIKKASELFGILNMVFFSPEDLNIIKNGPSERRRFLDAEICQLDKIYLSDLTQIPTKSWCSVTGC